MREDSGITKQQFFLTSSEVTVWPVFCSAAADSRLRKLLMGKDDLFFIMFLTNVFGKRLF